MKINKKSIFIILLLSILLLCNSIYATNPNDTDREIDKIDHNYQSKTIENNEDSYIQNVNSDNTLKSALSNVTNSEKKYNEINFETKTYNLRNTFNTENTNQIEKIIVLNGNNSIIDGNNRRKFANIDKRTTLILNNLTIRNMNFNIGGALSNSGTLIVNNCIFENNTSTDENMFGGGAIFNEGSMNITNSSFKNNYAFKSGSSIYTTENLNNNTYINIENCIFENNYANTESTLHSFGSTAVNIINSTFKNNTALTGSTIVNENSNLTINNTLILNEKSLNILTNNKNLIVNNLSITQNEIKNNVILNDNNLFINNSKIYKNYANKIIENNMNAEINNSTINNNSVNESLITNNVKNISETNLTVNQSIISNNDLNSYGIVNNLNSTSTFTSTLFQNNTSKNSIIEDFNGTTRIYNSEFINNTSLKLFNGNQENFVAVSNNYYSGNNLNSKINFNYSCINNVVIINGKIQTDEIYNTSVNKGYFSLLQEENLLKNIECNCSEFNIESPFNKNSNLTLILSYNGENHFKNQQEDLIVSSYNDEYEIKITNLVEKYVYGDLINYDVILHNRGIFPVENIQLQYLIPSELTLINSTHKIDNDNSCTIPQLNVNETIVISINCTPKHYKKLNLIFDIYDIKQDVYTTYEKNITFIPPNIELNSTNAHIGDIVNISAYVNNYNKKSIDNISFKFQYKQANVDISFENNTIFINNYKINDNLVNKGYIIELICNDTLLENTFSNSSKLYLSKLNTYSKINYNYSNNYVNISAIFYDENNCLITNGSVILKIDGISIKTFKLNKGMLDLFNLRIDKKNQLNESEILFIYIGNNKYNNNRNSSCITLNKKEINLNVSYEIKNGAITIYANLDGFENESEEKGYLSFKINGKSMSPKIYVINNTLVETFNANYYNLNNLTISYYGNTNYLEKTITIPLKE